LVYFHRRPAHTHSNMVYFQGWPPTYSRWSIFTGDLPFWVG
jgi:hypothetical protein